jgi:peptidoglycan/xylan/chitin deacetylase (PgdA/CDA1 family)
MSRLFFTWDDGHPDDLRLAALHEKYAVPCMLFVPAANAEGRPVLTAGELRGVCSDTVEVGAHTYHHRYLTELTPAQVAAELSDGKKYLEDATGRAAEHFCFPGGRYNRQILRETLSIYKTARTAETMRTRHRFPLVDTTFHFFPRGWKSVLYHSCRNREGNILRAALQSCRSMGYFELITRYLLSAAGEERDVIIWGHSWELTERRLWGQLEALLQLVAGSLRGCAAKYSQIY